MNKIVDKRPCIVALLLLGAILVVLMALCVAFTVAITWLLFGGSTFTADFAYSVLRFMSACLLGLFLVFIIGAIMKIVSSVAVEAVFGLHNELEKREWRERSNSQSATAAVHDGQERSAP